MSSHDEREPWLEALGAAWRDPDGDAAPPAPELEEQDEATRAAVQWMRSAWNADAATEAPAMPAALRRAAARRRPRGRVLRFVLPLAAAAALALWLRGSADRTDPAPAPAPRGHDRVATGTPAPAPTVVAPHRLDAEPLAARPITFEPDQIAQRRDGLELVTGKVRVILLEPAPR